MKPKYKVGDKVKQTYHEDFNEIGLVVSILSEETLSIAQQYIGNPFNAGPLYILAFKEELKECNLSIFAEAWLKLVL